MALNFKNPFEPGGALFRPEVVADRVTKPRLVPEWMDKDKTFPLIDSTALFKGLNIVRPEGLSTMRAWEDICSILPADSKYELNLSKSDEVRTVVLAGGNKIKVQQVIFDINKKDAYSSKDNGIILLYNLTHSLKKYLYEVSENVSYKFVKKQRNSTDGVWKTISSNDGVTDFDFEISHNQIENLSQTDMYDIEKVYRNNNVPISQVLKKPQENFDGYIVLSRHLGIDSDNCLFLDSKHTQIAPRAGIVFHELWENWERTQNGKYYPEAHATAKKAGRNFTNDRKTVDVYYNKYAQ